MTYFTLHNIEVMHNDFLRNTTYETAIKAIKELGDNWRLPTIGELGYLHDLHKLGVGNFSDEHSYWSSNRVGAIGCEIIKMYSGYKGVAYAIGEPADHNINTRLVRDIPSPR